MKQVMAAETFWFGVPGLVELSVNGSVVRLGSKASGQDQNKPEKEREREGQCTTG